MFDIRRSTILVVDDSPKNLDMFISMLTPEGYVVITASNGIEALEIAQTTPPDLILLDIIMPEMDGFETCKAFKANEQFADTPVIFLTALDAVDDIVKGFEAGGVDYIHRPFAMETILARVDTHLNLYHMRRELEGQNKQLKKQHGFLERVIESVDNPFYVINVEDYSIEIANQAARSLGISSANTCYALTHKRDTPCDGSNHPCPLKTVTETKQPTVVEHIHYDADGNPYDVEVHAYPIFDEMGEITQMIEYSIDITKRKATESLLRLLWRAFDQSMSIIVISDPSGTIEYINPKFTEVTGYLPEEAIGANVNILKSGQTPPEVYGELWETITSEKEWNGEFYNRKKNGELYWESASISPVIDGNGNTTHYLAVKEDITERKKAEQQLLELMFEKERVRILSNFITQASHEFRTPLSIINTSIYFLDRLEKTDRQDKQIRKIETQVTDLIDLVDALVTMSELDSLPQLHVIDFDLCEIIEMVLEQHPPIQTDGLQESLFIQGDPKFLKLALHAIIDNAIQFTPSNGIVSLHVSGDDDNAIIDITDSGSGIDTDDLPHIFGRFYRSDKAGTKRGFGLGLPITKRIIDLHHGTIEVESEIGQGSTFRITLPR